MVCPVPDIEDLVEPTTGAWEVAARPLADVLADADDPGLVLALPVPIGGLELAGPVADALALVGLEADFVAAAWEPSGEAGTTTVIPLPPR